MSIDVILTVSFAVAAVLGLYVICARILRGWVAAAFVVLPLAGIIPWTKRFPAIGDAVTLAAVVGILGLWLYVEGGGARRVRTAVIVAAVILLLKPEILLLVLAAIVYEAWRRGAMRRAETRRAVAAAVGAAVISVLVTHPISPVIAVQGLCERLYLGTAWDGANWTLAGTDIRTSMKTAATYGATFYIPLLAPFVALALPYRRERWFAPLFAWCAGIVVLSVLPGRMPVLRASPPMAAALLVAFGVTAVMRLREEFGRRATREGLAPAQESPTGPR